LDFYLSCLNQQIARSAVLFQFASKLIRSLCLPKIFLFLSSVERAQNFFERSISVIANLWETWTWWLFLRLLRFLHSSSSSCQTNFFILKNLVWYCATNVSGLKRQISELFKTFGGSFNGSDFFIWHRMSLDPCLSICLSLLFLPFSYFHLCENRDFRFFLLELDKAWKIPI
jgi:hypothetical protein